LKIHLDTDFGGDIDDLCALAMLLRWPGVEITAITTSAEENGKRAGYVRHTLKLEQRDNIPVAAGANSHLKHPYPDEKLYWGEPIALSPNPVDKALLLLKQSIERGAVVVAIGPLMNLCLLEKKYTGILRNARLFLMGGYIYPPRKGFPQWSNSDDYNIQIDTQSAEYVLKHSNPTLVPVSITGETFLRRAYLEKLKTAGALGQLIARQAESFANDEKMEEKYGKTCSDLPHDIINFQHDPVASAIALGWDEGVEIEQIPLKIELRDGLLEELIDGEGKPTQVVTKIDGNRFSQFWLETMTGYQS
jgi:purine nucleosidase